MCAPADDKRVLKGAETAQMEDVISPLPLPALLAHPFELPSLVPEAKQVDLKLFVLNMNGLRPAGLLEKKKAVMGLQVIRPPCSACQLWSCVGVPSALDLTTSLLSLVLPLPRETAAPLPRGRYRHARRQGEGQGRRAWLVRAAYVHVEQAVTLLAALHGDPRDAT